MLSLLHLMPLANLEREEAGDFVGLRGLAIARHNPCCFAGRCPPYALMRRRWPLAPGSARRRWAARRDGDRRQSLRRPAALSAARSAASFMNTPPLSTIRSSRLCSRRRRQTATTTSTIVLWKRRAMRRGSMSLRRSVTIAAINGRVSTTSVGWAALSPSSACSSKGICPAGRALPRPTIPVRWPPALRTSRDAAGPTVPPRRRTAGLHWR